MVNSLYVVGGRQRKPASIREAGGTWYGYGAGVILGVDGRGGCDVVHTYVSDLDVRSAEDPMLFKCATRVGERLYCTTETEVVIYELPTFDVVHKLSHPWFNDVHHVIPAVNGNLLVASSGAETVLELTVEGELVTVYPLDDERKQVLAPDTGDLRFGVNLKPHKIHPNHLFAVDGEPWATRFECRDAVSLVDPNRRINIGRERVHDGHVVDGLVWFTTVDGAVVVANPDTGAIEAEYDLNANRRNVVPGWCRGLLITDASVWVGFSRIRMTAARERLSWIRQGLSTSLPTRIEKYDRATMELESSVELEDCGLDAVFTITEQVS